MKTKLLFLFIILFSLNSSNAQDIQLYNKIVGHSDPNNYYIGNFSVPGSAGLDIHWYGGIRFGDSYNYKAMEITNGNVSIEGALRLGNGISTTSTYLSGVYGVSYAWNINNLSSGYNILSTKPGAIPFNIDFDGNVGIGTTTPSSKLDVRGIISTPEIAFRNADGGDSTDPYRLRKVQGSSWNDHWLELQLNDDPNESFRIYGNSCAGFGCGEYSNNLYHSFDAQGNVFHSGNVGIGTTSLSEKLTVNGNIVSGNANGQDGGLFLGNNSHGIKRASNNVEMYTHGVDGNLLFSTYLNQEKMRIIPNGNVGIGTTTPDEKLTVNGKIHSKEIIVDTNIFPDYVFQKYYTGKSELKADYVMPTLAEIENFAKKNNHLPNVPSAKEIQQKGVSLGEMSNILLQKVEELTLYAIEQNKELDRLKKENENYKSLAERLSALEKELKK